MIVWQKIKLTQKRSNEVFSNVKTIFENIYKILEPQGFEFAYRTVAEVKKYIIAAYMLNNKPLDSELLNQTIDEQIVQKLLPKIHGNKKIIGDMLHKLLKLCDDSQKLVLSHAKISQMIAKLDAVQYASFI